MPSDSEEPRDRDRPVTVGSSGRVLYLLMTHTAPEQVLRLLRTMRALSPMAPLVVHHDERWVQLDRSQLEAIGNVTYLPAEASVDWGEWSQIESLFSGLRRMDALHDYDWVVQ